jgi:hypothetical protein
MRSGIAVVAIVCLLQRAVWGDTFTYLDREGKSETVEARLVAEKEGALLLGLADGEYRIRGRTRSRSLPMRWRRSWRRSSPRNCSAASCRSRM